MTTHHKRAIDRHFAGGSAPDEEAAMWAHLEGCEECRDYFHRHQMLARLDPKALSTEERIARALGVGPQPRRRARLAGLIGAGALAATAALVLLVVKPWEPRGMVPRGQGGQTEVVAYRVTAGAQHTALGSDEKIARTDELAFAYRNPERFPWLMIFAVDGARRVYWYHPAWSDERSDPSSIPARATPEIVELPDAVRHELPAGPLVLHALFTRTPLTVRAVERRLAEGAPLLAGDEGRLQRIPLTITP